MKAAHETSLPFNTALETGMRSVCLLVAAFPQKFDLHRLVVFNHLVVHTGDVGGPDSLHPAVPMRSAEILVRRGLVERGLLLMASRGLAVRCADETGISYQAGDFAETFLTSLSSPYIVALLDRAVWVVDAFSGLTDEPLKERIGTFFDRWIEQFQVAHKSSAGEP